MIIREGFSLICLYKIHIIMCFTLALHLSRVSSHTLIIAIHSFSFHIIYVVRFVLLLLWKKNKRFIIFFPYSFWWYTIFIVDYFLSCLVWPPTLLQKYEWFKNVKISCANCLGFMSSKFSVISIRVCLMYKYWF